MKQIFVIKNSIGDTYLNKSKIWVPILRTAAHFDSYANAQMFLETLPIGGMFLQIEKYLIKDETI